MLAHDDLTFLISAANIAGYMERSEEIYIPDDDTLTDFVVKAYDAWKNPNKGLIDWHSYIVSALRDTFTPHFFGDAEKMADFFVMTKAEFLASYSYLTEAEYDATMKKYIESEMNK